MQSRMLRLCLRCLEGTIRQEATRQQVFTPCVSGRLRRINLYERGSGTCDGRRRLGQQRPRGCCDCASHLSVFACNRGLPYCSHLSTRVFAISLVTACCAYRKTLFCNRGLRLARDILLYYFYPNTLDASRVQREHATAKQQGQHSCWRWERDRSPVSPIRTLDWHAHWTLRRVSKP